MRDELRSVGGGMYHERKRNLWGIILAGGEGIRLRNFVEKIYGYFRPKQYCRIIGTKSLIRHTRDRAQMLIPRERLMTIVNREHVPFVLEELGDQPPETIVVQPSNKETSAGILLPVMKIYKQDSNSVITTFPSDHFVYHEQRFMEYVRDANEFVIKNPDAMVMLGIVPERNESGYGWIEKAGNIFSGNGKRVYRVLKFWEKPGYETARVLLGRGCLWNSFVIVGTAESFIKYIKMFAREVYDPLYEIRDYIGTPLESSAIGHAFDRVPVVNFSRFVLERIREHLYVMEVPDVYWNDWGEEHRIKRDIERFGLDIIDRGIPGEQKNIAVNYFKASG